MIAGEGITEEVGETEARHANEDIEEDATVIEEIQVKRPFIPQKEKGREFSEATKKIMTTKTGGTPQKTTAKGKKRTIKKTA